MRNPLARLVKPFERRCGERSAFLAATLTALVLISLISMSTSMFVLPIVALLVGVVNIGTLLYCLLVFDVLSIAQRIHEDDPILDGLVWMTGFMITVFVVFGAVDAGLTHGILSAVATFFAFSGIVPPLPFIPLCITAIQAVAYENNQSVRATAHQLYYANVKDTSEEALREEVRERDAETETETA